MRRHKPKKKQKSLTAARKEEHAAAAVRGWCCLPVGVWVDVGG